MKILRNIADRLHAYSTAAAKEKAHKRISCGLISPNETTDGLAQLVSLALSDFRGGTLVQYLADSYDREGRRDTIEHLGILNGKFYVSSKTEQLVALDICGYTGDDGVRIPRVQVKESEGAYYTLFRFPYLAYYITIAPEGVIIPRPEEREHESPL